MSTPRTHPIRLAVFPLEDLVFFPTTQVPLNIFEPRYLQMVEDSLSSGMPIAISRFEPTDSEVNHALHLMGYGRPQVIERRKDGTMIILMHGLGKGRLIDVVEEEPYFLCNLEPVRDRNELRDEYREDFERLTRLLFKWIEQNFDDPEQKEFLMHSFSEAQQVVEALAQALIRDSDIQQSLLELNDINERIKVMKFLF